jgi:hypothetical protein
VPDISQFIEDWDARQAIERIPLEPFAGRAWRAHWKGYSASSWSGSLKFSGRYNRGPIEFPGERI